MSLERQTIYGWPIAVDLFLGGMGAGAFLAGLVLNILKMQEPVARFILTVSPFLVLIGSLFLLADITVRSRVYRLFSNFKSWTSRGTWILTIFLVSGFNYSLLSSPYISFFPLLDNSVLVWVTGAVAAFFSLLVLIYPGFLMGTMSAVSFWNTPMLPVLFLISGLSNGIAFLLLITPLFLVGINGMTEFLHIFGAIFIVLTLLLAMVLYAFLDHASRGNVASRESLQLLEASQFKQKMFGACILIPFFLLLFALLTGKMFLMSILSMAAAILSLSGGLYLRRAIIYAGVFLPRFNI
jgi:polysulfide reductase chain C